MADTLTSAVLTGDCKYIKITVTAINLTLGTTYQVNYSVVQTGASDTQQPAGAIIFTPTTTSQTVNQMGNWNPPLTTDVTLHDGTATLTSSGSTVQIPPLTINCGTPKWSIVGRAMHVLALVVWVGGVWLVITVPLSGMRQKPPEEWMREFHAIEQRFAPQARLAMLLVLLTGLYILYQDDLWKRFAYRHYWWMHFMVGVWLLAVVEQLIIRHTLYKRVTTPPHRMLMRILLMHSLILAFLLFAIFAAIGGSHGLF
jgi:hypothetical protein